MKKLKHRHCEAIAHAKLFLLKAFATNPEPRFKREIEEDIELLDDLRKFVLHVMYNPKLPFDIDKLDEDIRHLHEEHNRGPADAGQTD